MTITLVDYFKNKVNKSANILHVPMTVDYERFTEYLDESYMKGRYIAYCGYIGNNAEGINKDGIPILIEAFQIVSQQFCDIKLMIIGYTYHEEDNLNLRKLVLNLGIQEKVIFAGIIENTKIPALLCNATILALARPNSFQAKGGFPTKLGEYLMTGKPVVVTKVGEIENYLTDGYDAFLAEPDSVLSFAEKLITALSDEEIAKQIGNRGRENALNNFNNYKQTENILRFIKKLQLKRKQ